VTGRSNRYRLDYSFVVENPKPMKEEYLIVMSENNKWLEKIVEEGATKAWGECGQDYATCQRGSRAVKEITQFLLARLVS